MRVRTLLEQRQEGAGHAHQAVEVDREQPLEVLFADLVEATGERDARVVEEQVDRRVCCHHQLRVRGDLRPVGDIERVAGDAQAERRELGGERFQRRRSDVGQREVATARGEPEGERAADAAARAGDDGGLTAEGQAAHRASRRRKWRAESSSRLYRVTMRSLK